MRLKPTDQSVTYSEIQFDSPEPTDRQHLEDLKEEQPNSPPKHEKKVSMSEQKSQSTPPKRQRNYTGGRVGFKGTLKYMYKTKKDSFVNDGTQMLQVQKDIKQTEDKILIMQARINALQKKEETTKKNIEKVQKQEQFIAKTQRTVQQEKITREEISRKKQEDLQQQQEKIKVHKIKKAESIDKLKRDKELQSAMIKEKAIKDKTMIEQMRIEREIEIKKDIEEKHKRIQEEKQSVSEKKKLREQIFLGRIQRCYHKEKEQKEKLKEENQEKIKELEKIEQQLLEQLKNTQMIEQQLKARTFGVNESMSSSSKGFNLSQKSPNEKKPPIRNDKNNNLPAQQSITQKSSQPTIATKQILSDPPKGMIQKGSPRLISSHKLIPRRPQQKQEEEKKIEEVKNQPKIDGQSPMRPEQDSKSKSQMSFNTPGNNNRTAKRIGEYHYQKAQNEVKSAPKTYINQQKETNAPSNKTQEKVGQHYKTVIQRTSQQQRRDSSKVAEVSAKKDIKNTLSLPLDGSKPRTITGGQKQSQEKNLSASQSMKEISPSKKNLANDILNETQPQVYMGTLDSQRLNDIDMNNSVRVDANNKNPFEVSAIHGIDNLSDSRNDSMQDMDSFELEKDKRKPKKI